MEKKSLIDRDRFTFYKSYYDTYKELPIKDRPEFIETIMSVYFLEKKLEDIKPSTPMLKLAFSSISHSIKNSIKGLFDKLGIDYNLYPWQGGIQGAYQQYTISNKEEVKDKYICANFDKLWKEYPSDSRRRKDDCIDIYNKYCTSKEKEEEFSKALSNYKQSKKFKEGYVQNSITWFRDWNTWLDYTREYTEEEKRMIARGLCLD